MKKILISVFGVATLFGSTASFAQSKVQMAHGYVEYASPLVGSLSTYAFSNGNTYPAIAMPWGMNFWTPQTAAMGDGWTYNYATTIINGFKQTHQPSPWINDYGQFAIMPVVGENKFLQKNRKSWFSHKAEVARPNYYGVYLADHDIFAELSPTERAVVMDFTYPLSDSSSVVVDAYDKGSYVKIVDDRTIVGYSTRNSGGVPDNFKNYFVIKFNKPFSKAEVSAAGEVIKGNSVETNHAIAQVFFSTKRGEKVTARIASSFISEAQALQNLKEVDGRSLAEVREAGARRWNEVLGKIKVGGGTEDQYRTFYSCLYRCLLFPRKFYEIDAQGKAVHYSPYNGKVEDGYMYTDTGFWDTFRALFPLLNLVYPEINAEIQQGLANTYRESGFLPEWASPGHRDCMVGNNSAAVVSDAIMKGVTPAQDIETLFEAMMSGTDKVHPSVKSTGRLGHQYYNTLGYIPYDVKIKENIARTLEYCYNDWTILQTAKKLGKSQSIIDTLEKRSQYYRNVFDKESNLMRGRKLDGSFQAPFSPYKWGDAYTEGNAWHYTWSVFHDPKGLIELMGGDKGFQTMLDSVFVVPPIYDDSYYGARIHEITEMQVANMGNYAHGNQPAQHMIYLYNYAGAPWKTQFWARETMDKLYTALPDGYCGDEDNGQTSAWYVFSSLGFYPVCPGSDEYVLGSPQFQKVVVTLSNGKQIVIDAPNNTKSTRYVNSMKYNGRDYQKTYLNYSELMKGAKIDFVMSEKPNTTRATTPENRPYSMSE